MAGWFIITHHNFPQDSLSINWGTIPAWLSDGIWEQVKKKGRNKVALLHGETGAHTCRTDTNKTGKENVLQGKEAHREAGGFWGEKRSRNGIYMLCMCLFGGKGCEGMYCTYLMPAACLQWLSCLAWQSSWELLKGDRIRMESQAHRSPGWTEGNVLGPRPEGVYILSAFTASRSWIPKRKHATVFWARPPDVPFSKEEGLCELFFFFVLCAHLFVVPCIFDSHPSSFPFAVIGSCIKPHCFYSISCHYQQQFDYWVHLVGGEQWRQQAVFSFTLPPILSSPLERIKWGLPVRDEAHAAKAMPCLILLDVLMSTNTRGHGAKRGG